MVVLFWLQMPGDYQRFSRLCFTAQQLLLPRSSKVSHSEDESVDINAKVKAEAPRTYWCNYYERESTARTTFARDTKVVLGSHGKVISGQWYPASVRQFTKPSDGVWHPDDLKPVMFWFGGGFNLDDRGIGCFDPFRAMPPPVRVQLFTVQLHGLEKKMQWAVEQHGEHSKPERGNVPEARQDIKLGWLARKPDFLTFGALRAYPKQQMRKVIAALNDSLLPLDHPAVRLLLLQTFYHVGELSNDVVLSPVWRTDLAEHGGWKVLCEELDGSAEVLRYKPREHAAALVLGEIAAHASQWHDGCRAVARKFAQIARQWADDLEAEIAVALPKNVAGLCAKRCLYYMYGIVCYGAGELGDDGAGALCELTVLAEHSRLFGDQTALDDQVRALTTVTQSIMARRLPEVLAAIDLDSQPLTAALRIVLEATPAHLSWKRVNAGDVPTGCYEAEAGQNLFSINVQTGTILYNGLPPRRLPASILQMPLYIRTFADRNFEVVMDAAGVLSTTRPVSGRVYSFFVDAKGELIVREREDCGDDSVVLELLNGVPDMVKQWGGDLPIRLRHMHSHWLCRERQVVLLRPQHFNQRDVHFLLLADRSECFRIPEHQQPLPWWDLLAMTDSFDSLLLPKSSDHLIVHDQNESILRTLGKFETDRTLIHTYLSHKGDLLFELPRYGLAFELADDIGSSGGLLESKNYSGFVLSAEQQLDDALLGFDQYLVLEAGQRKRM